MNLIIDSVYPCTYRELRIKIASSIMKFGISLYLQGTHYFMAFEKEPKRYIPVPTGNSLFVHLFHSKRPVYPCTYRELASASMTVNLQYGISLYLQGTPTSFYYSFCLLRYIPVPTGNSKLFLLK